MTSLHSGEPLRWWRVPMLWLVIAGPAAVVVAGIATTVLAVTGADKPLREAALPKPQQHQAMTPATQARNHAAAPRH